MYPFYSPIPFLIGFIRNRITYTWIAGRIGSRVIIWIKFFRGFLRNKFREIRFDKILAYLVKQLDHLVSEFLLALLVKGMGAADQFIPNLLLSYRPQDPPDDSD